jgi:hypothetical protein
MEACLFATDFSFESSYIHMSLSLAGFALGRRECTSVADGVITGAGSKKHCCVGPVRRVALPEGELAEARQAREVAEEKVHDLSSSLAEGS